VRDADTLLLFQYSCSANLWWSEDDADDQFKLLKREDEMDVMWCDENEYVHPCAYEFCTECIHYFSRTLVRDLDLMYGWLYVAWWWFRFPASPLRKPKRKRALRAAVLCFAILLIRHRHLRRSIEETRKMKESQTWAWDENTKLLLLRIRIALHWRKQQVAVWLSVAASGSVRDHWFILFPTLFYQLRKEPERTC